jgi:hypothetical protein
MHKASYDMAGLAKARCTGATRGCCYDRPGTHPDRRKGVGGSNASSFLMLEAPPICECPAGLTVLTVPEAIAWRAASCVNYFTRTKTIIV